MFGVVSRLGRKQTSQVSKAAQASSEPQVLDMFWSGMTYVPHAALLFNTSSGVLKVNSMAQALFECREREEITQIFREGLDPCLHLRMMNAARGVGSSVTDMPVRIRSRGMDLSLNVSIMPLPQFGEQAGNALMLVREIEHSQIRRTHAPQSAKAFTSRIMQDVLNRLPQPAWIIKAPFVTTYRNAPYSSMLSRCARAFLEGQGLDDVSCQGCNAPEDLTLAALHEAVSRARTQNEVVDFPINLGHCGAWTLALTPCADSDEGDVACIAMPASESTAAASIAGALASLEEPTALVTARQAAEKVSAIEALQEARDLERNTIAREIHDALGQELTVLRLSLRRLWQGVKGSTDLPPHLETEATIIREQLDKVTSSARRIAHELRSDGVKSMGFSSAAHSLVTHFQERLDIQGQMEVNGNWVEPDQQVGWHLYRTLQELLNNIIKHAYASRFNVRVSLTDGHYRLEVSDDGVGIPESSIERAGLGLRSIQERAELHQGKVTIRSRPQVPGSVIEIMIPAPASLEIS